MDKRYKLLRARLMVPLGESPGRDLRIRDAYVLTDNDRIKESGAFTEEIRNRILADCAGDLLIIGSKNGHDVPCLDGLILPGFIKAHGHDHEPPLIGVARDEPLTEWLDHSVNLFTGFLIEERSRLEKEFGCSPNLIPYRKARLDDISYGITSSMVHHCNFNKYRVAEIVQANREAGTTMFIAVGSQDRNYDKRILDTVDEAVERLDKYHAEFSSEERTSVLPGPDQLFSNGPELLKALKAWAEDHSVLFHCHSSEEPNTTRWFTEEYGMTPVEYAQSIGILNERTLLAHQVHTTENDLDILASTGTMIVHNPLANTILGSGMPPVIQMLEKGIKVAISTDGSGSADNQNIISAARLASQYQKALNQNARLLPAQKVLEMITVEPSRMLGLDAGSIEAGKKADIILVDLRRPNLVPTRADNVVENLIWSANGDEIRYVMAGGRLLVDDYRFTSLDKERILDQVRRLSELFSEYRNSHKEITGTGAHRQ